MKSEKCEKLDVLGVKEQVRQQIEKKFGRGFLYNLNEKIQMTSDEEVIKSGFFSLDYALGGGYRRGKIHEFFGAEGEGKTTLALLAIANAQRQNPQGGYVAFIDAEHSLNPDWALKLGVDLSKMDISQPDYGEQAFEIIELLISSGVYDVIVVDSVAALTPKSVIEGNYDDVYMAAEARMMSQSLRKLISILGKSSTVLIFVNQIREKIGTFFGNSETTPGGRALKFFSRIRCQVSRKEYIKQGEDKIGHIIEINVVKNGFAPPFKKAYIEIIYGKGVGDELDDLINFALQKEIIVRVGNTYCYGNDKFVGKNRLKEFLKDEVVLSELKTKIKELL